MGIPYRVDPSSFLKRYRGFNCFDSLGTRHLEFEYRRGMGIYAFGAYFELVFSVLPTPNGNFMDHGNREGKHVNRVGGNLEKLKFSWAIVKGTLPGKWFPKLSQNRLDRCALIKIAFENCILYASPAEVGMGKLSEIFPRKASAVWTCGTIIWRGWREHFRISLLQQLRKVTFLIPKLVWLLLGRANCIWGEKEKARPATSTRNNGNRASSSNLAFGNQEDQWKCRAKEMSTGCELIPNTDYEDNTHLISRCGGPTIKVPVTLRAVTFLSVAMAKRVRPAKVYSRKWSMVQLRGRRE